MRSKLAFFATIAGLLIGKLAATGADSPQKKVFVVLLGGQSNAAGWGYHQFLVETKNPLANPQEDVDFYTGTGLPAMNNRLTKLQCGGGNPKLASDKKAQRAPLQFPALVGTDEMMNHFGPELSLGRTIRDRITIPGSKVAVIKSAVGGSTLFVQWLPDGTAESASDGKCYKEFQITVHDGLAALKKQYPGYEIEIIGMAWVQGESDAIKGQSGKYQKNLTTFIQDVRATFGKNIVFALSKFSPNQGSGPAFTELRAAQEAVAATVPKVIVTETIGDHYSTCDDFAEGRIHYQSAALLQIGQDLGNAIADAALKPKPPTQTRPILKQP